MNYTDLLTKLIQNDEQQLLYYFPTISQWHTPIFDTLTWGEVYPLLGQWLKQVSSDHQCTNVITSGQVTITEWLLTLRTGGELLLCIVIDPTTTHGMDVRMYHSFVPLFHKNQTRGSLPIQAETRSVAQTFTLAQNCYYLPAYSRKAVQQKHAQVNEWVDTFFTSRTYDVHTQWSSVQAEVYEYSTQAGAVGVLICGYDENGEVNAIRNYNDWEHAN